MNIRVVYHYIDGDSETYEYDQFEGLQHDLIKRKRNFGEDLLLVSLYDTDKQLNNGQVQELRRIQEPELLRVKS